MLNNAGNWPLPLCAGEDTTRFAENTPMFTARSILIQLLCRSDAGGIGTAAAGHPGADRQLCRPCGIWKNRAMPAALHRPEMRPSVAPAEADGKYYFTARDGLRPDRY